MGLLGQRSEEDDDDGDISLVGLEHLDDRPREVTRDLSGCREAQLDLLRSRMETLGLPHRWAGSASLVISANDEAWFDKVLDQAAHADSPPLQDGLPQIAYDLTGWDDEQRRRLGLRLADRGIPNRVDALELVVHERDEPKVDLVIDELVG